MGKLSQAVVIAAAAYRDEATFRERTGITNSRLVVNKKATDCHVSSSGVPLHSSPAAQGLLCTEKRAACYTLAQQQGLVCWGGMTAACCTLAISRSDPYCGYRTTACYNSKKPPVFTTRYGKYLSMVLRCHSLFRLKCRKMSQNDELLGTLAAACCTLVRQLGDMRAKEC